MSKRSSTSQSALVSIFDYAQNSTRARVACKDCSDLIQRNRNLEGWEK